MSTQHTPGRLVAEELDQDADYTFVIRQIDGDPYPLPVADCNRPADARRLVACWNACEMVSTEDLEALTRPADVSWACTIDRLVRERDELLEALKRIVDWDDVGLALTQDHVVQARAAIAKVEGGAA
ncbi:hypothetical protein [Macromonas nakdongensis]|uniref:hypothetical protein n=1 Tax=Macromonas nakdongensis TaxID=1843082 RepID=UPI000C338F2F|nr:hypothetical protein [Macromonas nakdongensis]